MSLLAVALFSRLLFHDTISHPIHVAPCHGCSSLFIHYLLHHEGCKPCTSQDVLHKCPCSTGLLIFKIESSGMNWGVEGKCGRCLDTLQYNSRITQLKIVSHKYFPPFFSDDDPCMLWPKRKYSCVFIPHPPPPILLSTISICQYGAVQARAILKQWKDCDLSSLFVE